MMVLEWDDKLATGLPQVDIEHRRLIDLINNLGHQRTQGAGVNELVSVLKDLHEYTIYHFKNEERLMQEYQVTPAHRDLHFKAHKGFIDRLASASELVASNPHDVIDHLLAFLVKWLVFHINGIDARMAREIKALQEGKSAAPLAQHALEETLVRTVSELYDSLGMRTFEMVELNCQLQQEIEQRRRSEDALRLAALVYEHGSEAMLVTDADNHIIAVNPAFSAVTGYSAGEVLGKNPKFLRSGRQPKAFYEDMWRSIRHSGHWSGEIWNRRKDGEEYAEWLTINTILNPDRSVHRYVALFSDITEKKKTDELILTQANFDALTQLPNRRLFHDRLEQEIKKAQRSGRYLALLFLDLDHFKEVNDTMGHHVGDQLLVDAAKRIVDCVRASDTVARLGGDEFTVILSDITDTDQIERVTQSIIDRLNQPFRLGGELAYISASIGITVYPNDAEDAETLLMNADQSMYASKHAGRNRYSYFTNSLQTKALKRQQVLKEMREAISRREFCVYFQPIVDVESGRIYKAEALLRWNHPTRGLVSPGEFIPLAEESGLINAIGDFAFRESVHWAKRWNEISPYGFQISVNKSPVQFHNTNNDHEDWLHYLESSQLPKDSLIIEITEGLLMGADNNTSSKLLKFRLAGVQVAIDDFGTGYSAFSYLKKMEFDFLKIDQSFVHDMQVGSNDLALCEAIIVMAHKLGLKVVAEGVESEEQRRLLTAAGCDFIQGYLYSRPVPPQEFEVLLRNNLASLGVEFANDARRLTGVWVDRQPTAAQPPATPKATGSRKARYRGEQA